MSVFDISRNILILTLQLTIIENAKMTGWTTKILNDKQLELTKKWNPCDDYDTICFDLLKPIHKNQNYPILDNKNNALRLF